jgi:uncharacterized protein YgfB (UPF0149 family)
LNVFLAIAVDNLANAHELTKDEEEEQAAEEEVIEFIITVSLVAKSHSGSADAHLPLNVTS